MSIKRPRMFVGSSSEGLKVARALCNQLQDQLEMTPWSSGVFGLGEGTLATLLEKAPTFDFATLVLTPDDMTISRNVDTQSPRDNVIFEAGMFMGILGSKRTFIVFDSDRPIKIPSDLAGITLARYKGDRSDGNLFAAVEEACHLIGASVENLGQLTSSVGYVIAASRAIEDKSKARKTVWFMGSATELDHVATGFLDKLLPELCSRLVALNTRIVVGDSPMLRKIATSFRAAMPSSSKFIPNPVVIEGSLRDSPAQILFLETIGQVPDIAILIGGSKTRGRVAQEYESAVRAGIPVLSIGCVGGAGAELRSTAEGAAPIDALLGTDLKLIDSGELSRKIAQMISNLQ